MTTKQFVTPENLGEDFEKNTSEKRIKINIDNVTIIRNASGQLEAVGGGGGESVRKATEQEVADRAEVDAYVPPNLLPEGGGGDSVVYNITELPEGAEAPVATGEYSVAAGNSALAEAFGSTAIGHLARAEGDNNTAIGRVAHAEGDNSTALGAGASAEAHYATALGMDAKAEADYATAVGGGAIAAGLGGVAIGRGALATGSGSTAIGPSARAEGANSVALGELAITSKDNQLSIAYLSPASHLAETPRLVSGVATPEVGQDAANKAYVDAAIAALEARIAALENA